jgi:hypothetical protein
LRAELFGERRRRLDFPEKIIPQARQRLWVG